MKLREWGLWATDWRVALRGLYLRDVCAVVCMQCVYRFALLTLRVSLSMCLWFLPLFHRASQHLPIPACFPGPLPTLPFCFCQWAWLFDWGALRKIHFFLHQFLQVPQRLSLLPTVRGSWVSHCLCPSYQAWLPEDLTRRLAQRRHSLSPSQSVCILRGNKASRQAKQPLELCNCRHQ